MKADKTETTLILAFLIGAGLFVWSKKAQAPAVDFEEKILTGQLPSGFTASFSDLAQVEQLGYTKESPTYKMAVDLSYAEVESQLKPGEYVAYSPEKGYYAISESELSSFYSWSPYY